MYNVIECKSAPKCLCRFMSALRDVTGVLRGLHDAGHCIGSMAPAAQNMFARARICCACVMLSAPVWPRHALAQGRAKHLCFGRAGLTCRVCRAGSDLPRQRPFAGLLRARLPEP